MPEGGAPATGRRGWWLAIVAGAAASLWVAITNGFPLVFTDSGAYLRIGTELHYPTDRSAVYGLLIAPIARAIGLWGVAAVQALCSAILVAMAVRRATGLRDALALFAILLALAVTSSLPWFVGQIMPDLFTPFVCLALFLILFDERRGHVVSKTMLTLVLAALIAIHLSHIALGLGLAAVGTIAALMLLDRAVALANGARAIAAVALAVLGLSTLNLVAEHHFRPSLATDKFLAARLFDGGVGQPVLAQACAHEPLALCGVLAFVEDPHRAQPGQDYLWAADSPRAALDAHDPARLDAEEARLASLALKTDTGGVLRLALSGWGEQLVHAHVADGLAPYAERMQIVRQIRTHFPREQSAWAASREQSGRIGGLIWFPDEWLALAIAIAWPFILWRAIRRRDRQIAGLTILIGATILGNAAICGILSGPADRYQSRVLWLLPLLGCVVVARCLGDRGGRAIPAQAAG